MSLLEDVFLEDEAGEAQELERVIEGDEFDERPRSRSDSDENSEKEDEAEEEKRRVDPTNAKPKRVIKNPRFVLNPARLTGPRGIQVIPEHFKDFKFKGKGHEREDIDLVLKKLEHWAYRLYPKFQFEDCLKKIETLGKKRPVMVHLQKIRNDQITSEDQDTVVQKDSSDDEAVPAQQPEEDEFDKLLQQQIEIARATPGPGSVKKTPFSERPSMMPKATSSPSINLEQRERMLQNRRMAEERRLARLKQNTTTIHESVLDNAPEKPTLATDKRPEISTSAARNGNKSPSENDDNDITRRKSKSTVIDSSSDEEYDVNRKVSNNAVIETGEKGKDVSKNVKNTNEVDRSGKKDAVSELDDDGKVISSSRTKNSISNVIISDDEDDDSKQDCAIELADFGKVISPKSTKNKLNANSSEEATKRSNIDVKTLESNEYDELTSESPKKNIRSNVIDSSDSENDALFINDPITIEINKKYDNAKKPYKSKVFDSSDEEDIVVNESITVVVHNSTNHDKNRHFDIAKNTEDRGDILKEDIEIDDGDENKSNSNSKYFHEDNNLYNVVHNISENNENEKEVNVNQTDTNLDELMDVDFSDDF